MDLYIASHSREAARSLRERLVERGHRVMSRWIVEDEKFHRSVDAYTDEERVALALMDEQDVRAASDGIVVIAEPNGRFVPGGKHVETGIALGLGRPVYVVGSRENLFHWHPRVTVLPDADRLLDHLDRLRASV